MSVGPTRIERMFETATRRPSAEGHRRQTADEMAAAALADGPSARSVSLLTELPRKQLTDCGRLDYIRHGSRSRLGRSRSSYLRSSSMSAPNQ